MSTIPYRRWLLAIATTATVGNLDVNPNGDRLPLKPRNWTAPASTARTLVTQINLIKATDRGMANHLVMALLFGKPCFLCGCQSLYQQTLMPPILLTGYQAMIKVL